MSNANKLREKVINLAENSVDKDILTYYVDSILQSIEDALPDTLDTENDDFDAGESRMLDEVKSLLASARSGEKI